MSLFCLQKKRNMFSIFYLSSNEKLFLEFKKKIKIHKIKRKIGNLFTIIFIINSKNEHTQKKSRLSLVLFFSSKQTIQTNNQTYKTKSCYDFAILTYKAFFILKFLKPVCGSSSLSLVCLMDFLSQKCHLVQDSHT